MMALAVVLHAYNPSTPVIPALKKLRQENYEFKASLGYIARACFKNK
jgi:hypothetical protein